MDGDAGYVTVGVRHGGRKEVLTAGRGENGMWSVTQTGTWADGAYTPTARVADEAAHEKKPAAPTVTLDTQISLDRLTLVHDTLVPHPTIALLPPPPSPCPVPPALHTLPLT
ncbi:Ig-like domain-containing protein, partial [Salmonella enterica]|uniref:Ig-like domain-containing protein n=1 Tax=Salmonella enterica TaxID=28901 RepID=UPI00398C7065